MRLGDTIVMRTPGSANPIEHLWFVITEPDVTTHHCAMVNLTTLRGDKDQTVVLGIADHDYISHPSVVHYIGARIVDARQIRQSGSAGVLRMHQPCSIRTLRLIPAGVSASPFTPKKVIEFCRRAWS
jgi:hypothetical protein